ncbi:septal ring lytic transglycosylase RlpA [Veronia nyctiphanis]|uniref:Endolytic peptidoglycan transglycosylase RlpA n=1 Tax=Veronia nyctiphanis TaxID=1278244 RepID=A0A4Q0YQ21_9GAMM|nr:septal ring lytic transglycosylase RlpA family protein [Veronia nyctiphanis]RXJ73092.1 septal ring lytic transglycosylase RlpA [Veronia nyctiphanis]
MQKRIIISALILAGCSSGDRYQMSNDKTPEATPSLAHIEDAEPRYEAYSRAGNRDYTLNGQRYKVIKPDNGFKEEGLASWYGEKFHGHLTSNGEIYDMFSMSAAHKTLPLPSYVQVENTVNGKKAIVRVNDRGPFHEGRIIDLSYAAASKLGVLKTGTAPVKITLLKPKKPQDELEWQTLVKEQYFVQLLALSDKKRAEKAATNFSRTLGLPTAIKARDDKIFVVRLGPFSSLEKAQSANQTAINKQLKGAFIVTEQLDSAALQNLNTNQQ